MKTSDAISLGLDIGSTAFRLALEAIRTFKSAPQYTTTNADALVEQMESLREELRLIRAKERAAIEAAKRSKK